MRCRNSHYTDKCGLVPVLIASGLSSYDGALLKIIDSQADKGLF